MIVPVKILKAHKPDKITGLGAMDFKWHPTQPWIVTCGSDGLIKMWV
jgi:ribosome biogenesis protein ERB1